MICEKKLNMHNFYGNFQICKKVLTCFTVYKTLLKNLICIILMATFKLANVYSTFLPCIKYPCTRSHQKCANVYRPILPSINTPRLRSQVFFKVTNRVTNRYLPCINTLLNTPFDPLIVPTMCVCV